MSTQRRRAWEGRQARRLCERLRADNRVVTPVVTTFLVPSRKTRSNDRTVEANSVLLQAGENGPGADQPGHCLYKCCARIALHESGELHRKLARHDAVGVEDD